MAVVDVVIPTRNRANLTSAAVSSVIGQTFRDWHLYLVDDASDDGSVDELEERFGGDSRITIVRRAVPGRASAARQSGFEAGSSEWVALLDSDDIWHPEKLEKQLAVAADHSVVLCWHTWLRPDGTQRVTRRPTGSGRVSPLLTSNVNVALMRRELVRQVGAFVGDEHTPVLADEHIDFFVRLLPAADVIIVPEVLTWCRDHDGSRMSDSMSPATLQMIVDGRRPLLEPWRRDFAEILGRLSARYLNSGDRRRGVRLLLEGLRVAPGVSRFSMIGEFGPHAVRCILRPPRPVRN